jgi:NAD+ synthase
MKKSARISTRLNIDAPAVSRTLETFVQQQTSRLRRDGVVIGMSGGVDSSVTAALAVRALGRDRVLGLVMPERDSDPRAKRDALKYMGQLGMDCRVVPITRLVRALGAYKFFPVPASSPYKLKAQLCQEIHESVKDKLKAPPFSKILLGIEDANTRQFVAYYRTKNRIRMANLYFFAEQNNYLVAGTSNRSELLTGYFTQYGDSAADIMPLVPLYKTQVFQLAKYLNIPRAIIDKAPSSDLIPGISDEFSLNLLYRDLDLILYCIERGQSEKEIMQDLGVRRTDIRYVLKLMSDSDHMRRLPISPSLD